MSRFVATPSNEPHCGEVVIGMGPLKQETRNKEALFLREVGVAGSVTQPTAAKYYGWSFSRSEGLAIYGFF